MTTRPVQHTRGTPNDPPACPVWGWGRIGPGVSRSEPPSVLRVRADCGGRLFTPKLAIVMHNLVSLVTVFTLQGCRLRLGCHIDYDNAPKVPVENFEFLLKMSEQNQKYRDTRIR
jgi:hypothetical protein